MNAETVLKAKTLEVIIYTGLVKIEKCTKVH